MAKVTIELFDGADGEVKVCVNFDPPVKKGETPTNAQYAAVECLDAIQQMEAEHEFDEDEDEDE